MRDLLDAAIDEGEHMAEKFIEISILIEAGDWGTAREELKKSRDRIWFLDAKCRRLELRRGTDDQLVEHLGSYRENLFEFYSYLNSHCAPESGYNEDLSNEKMNAVESAHMTLIRAAVPIVGTKDPNS